VIHASSIATGEQFKAPLLFKASSLSVIDNIMSYTFNGKLNEGQFIKVSVGQYRFIKHN